MIWSNHISSDPVWYHLIHFYLTLYHPISYNLRILFDLIWSHLMSTDIILFNLILYHIKKSNMIWSDTISYNLMWFNPIWSNLDRQRTPVTAEVARLDINWYELMEFHNSLKRSIEVDWNSLRINVVNWKWRRLTLGN